MAYDVFISYSRKDIDIADKICAAFDRNNISYFIDRQGIGGAFEFPEVLANAILNCKIFLYLASNNSYASRFTNSEITFAFNEKEKNSILPYIIDGSNLPTVQRFIFSAINWRNIKEHPIDTVLIADILHLLGRETKVDDTRSEELPGGKDKILYQLVLKKAGPVKLLVVKCLKDSLGISLKAAKDLADNAPSVLIETPDKQELLTLKRDIEAYCENNVILEVKEEKAGASDSLYDIYVHDCGPSKLQMVKYIKDTGNIGLKEAKDLADSVPNTIFIKCNYDTALKIANEMRGIGAVVSVRKGKQK